MIFGKRSIMHALGRRFLILFLALIAATPAALAHPLSQGSLDVVVDHRRVMVSARVTLEEVSVTNMLATADPLRPPVAADSDEAFEQHAQYLVDHLLLSADGKALAGRVVRVDPAEARRSAGSVQNQHVTYKLEFQMPAGAGDPKKLELKQTVLTDVRFLPGTSWEATYVVRIKQVDRRGAEGLLLVAGKPISIDLDWSAAGADSGGPQIDRWRMFKDYLWHGIHHILIGYDHLLFISALVLATTKLWDLLKVVSVFTLAHTITLALAAMNWIHLPERIVEPMIAASIVFVAVQNVVWPRSSKGWGRLGAAFFFGLFHGLGFAGGLLEAMQEMPVSSKVLAIAAFSMGVEIGHQMIVLPLFSGLKIARHTRDDEAAKERLSLLAQRIGSAGVSVAGMFYLVVALRMSFGS
jgi:hydrogenase/urease accessory protein HupE